MKHLILILLTFILVRCSNSDKTSSQQNEPKRTYTTVDPTVSQPTNVQPNTARPKFVQPPPVEATPDATVLNPNVKVLNSKKGGVSNVRSSSKGHDYSKLPNFKKDYSPGEVTKACLTNLAGGRVSEARKFTNAIVAKSMRLNGNDAGPIIKNMKVTILDEKIKGNKAYVKFEDNASKYYGYHTFTRQNGSWVITESKSEKK